MDHVVGEQDDGARVADAHLFEDLDDENLHAASTAHARSTVRGVAAYARVTDTHLPRRALSATRSVVVTANLLRERIGDGVQ